MRGEGGYDDGSEEAPRLTVLDLQVEREGGREEGRERRREKEWHQAMSGHLIKTPPSILFSLPPSLPPSGANAAVS